MAPSGGGRKRWTDKREVKEPTLYDEWLKQEIDAKRKQNPRRQSTPLRHGDTTASTAGPSGGTIKAATPDETADADADADVDADTDASMESASEDPPIVPGRGTSSFEPFKPYTTTTILGGPAAVADVARPHSSASKPRKLIKERAPSSRNGSSGAGMLARNRSKSNGSRAQEVLSEKAASKSARYRARTLEEQRREPSPTNVPVQNRDSMGSMPTSPSSGAEYLASVPAETSPPSAPSIRSVGSGGQNPLELAGQRSTSPESSSAGETKTSSQRGPSARRILHLMKTLNGRYSGNVLFRRNPDSAWNQIYCYIQQDSGDLMYEPRGGETAHRTLVSGLGGCGVRPNIDGETPYLEVSLPQLDTEIHLKLLTQVDFDSWYAALLYWQSLGPITSSLSNGARPSTSTSDNTARPEVPPRASSARKRRNRTGSSKSERTKSSVNTLKEAPVIKIGRMIYWAVGIAHDVARNTSGVVTKEAVRRPQVYRTHSDRSRPWRWISGQLRENGELKLHSDTSNKLISVVQLSQLSRCAIQRLDPSVMDDEFCIAIYPQYTSIPGDSQPGLIRPTFFSLENRVLYEVWFVLLRAFTIPQLYGPRIVSENGSQNNEADAGQDLENMLATRTTDMFRMERSLSVRIIEAKMYPSNTSATFPDSSSSGRQHGGPQPTNTKPERHGYYAEVLLDDETRGKTTVKFDALHPLWGEGFEFYDLPPVLSSATVVVKRRPVDAHAPDPQESRRVHETSDQQGGSTGLGLDVVCGKVEIYLQELEQEKEIEKWWPIVNMYHEPVGEILIKARAVEGVILMARDYQPLSEILHRFSNGITLQIGQMVPSELKRVSDCLLNIFQVSGRVSDWLMALAEEEIDGIHKETPITKLRFDRRVGSDGGHDALGMGSGNTDRELIVRDMNKTATFEANLLFRGNTLLTKSLDTHMRRVGREYLEESIGAKLRVINGRDPDCEVDPSRVSSAQDMERNWRRLLLCTQEVWNSILATKSRCPIELRLIFRHIRACAEDRYGDFLRSVSYSSVSGFLFLRFFCPAVLNPKLFGLLKGMHRRAESFSGISTNRGIDDIKPRARRAYTLIAKSLQTLSNMASFGTKETWMEPMNAFLTQNRASFKSFIDDVCYVPTPLSAATYTDTGVSSPTYPQDVTSAESNASYNTPMTVMQRLPPTSREGFPSLPFLIDQPRAYAELVKLWLEATTPSTGSTETTASTKPNAEVMRAIKAAGGELLAFHDICTNLSRRTQDCLNRAERVERPHSASSFKWDELIDQLKTDSNHDEIGVAEGGEEMPTQASFDMLADNLASDPSIVPLSVQTKPVLSREWDVLSADVDDGHHAAVRKTTPSQTRQRAASDFVVSAERPPSSGMISGLRDGLRRAQLHSRGSDSASASASNVSSAVSSDTEHTTGTTALPSYERELRHRERRDAAKQQIKQHVEAARIRETEKERRKVRAPIVSALRKKNQRENKSNAVEGYTSYGV